MVELPLAMLEQYADARVVVIDDDEASVLLLARILTQAGLREVRSYTDPRLALAELEQFRPDLVLTDLRMPQVPGEEVVQAVAAHAAGTYLPVLVVTADTSVAAPRQALQAGARDFVAKPIDAAEVTLRVRNLRQTRYLYLAQHE